MPPNLKDALSRLNAILPLHQRQHSLSKSGIELHKKLLRSFVETGRILNKEEIASIFEQPETLVDQLSSNDLITTDKHNNPTGAYPFTMEERPHQILVNEFKVHAMCALDALAISPMFDLPVQINSQCGISKNKILILQHHNIFNNANDLEDVYFAINWKAAKQNSCCANSLCQEMIFIKGHTLAERWLATAKSNHEKNIFPLPEAVALATAFFTPLL